MDNQHPISPPQELRDQWLDEAPDNRSVYDFLIDNASQWGADQELEACCKRQALLYGNRAAHKLLNARRPKPLSAIERAESLIECHEDGWVPSPAQWHVIREGLAEGRKALAFIPGENTLEALPDE